jgi:hypothetical protein
MDRSSNRRTHEKAAFAAVLWTLLSCGSGLANDADPKKTASSIKQALVESYAKRRALRLEYRFTSLLMATVPAGQYVRRVIAADRRGQFFLDNSHGHQSMDFVDDPFRKITFIYPTGFEIFRPLDRVVREYALPVPISLSRDMPGELMFLLSWWPFDAPERDMLGRKLSIEALKNDESYILRPGGQVVDGHLCDVIEVPKADSIWVDTANAHVIRRRELFDSDTGALGRRVEFGDYRTIGGDVHVPISMRISEFDYAARSAPDRERCVNRIDFQILDARSNEDVDIPAMAAIRPPGTIKASPKEEYELITGGEEDHARSIALWGGKQLDSSDNRPDSRPLGRLLPFLLSLAAGLAVGCSVLLVRAYFRARPSDGASSSRVHPA